MPDYARMFIAPTMSHGEDVLYREWTEYILSLAERVRQNDPALTHLQPFHDHRWGSPSLIQMRVAFDDETIQSVLRNLWDAARESRNTHVQLVTLPAVWSGSELRDALIGITHFTSLEYVDVIHESQSQNAFQGMGLIGTSSLSVQDLLAFLDEAPTGLKRLNVEQRLEVRLQQDLESLAEKLKRFTVLEALHLLFDSQKPTSKLTLNCLFGAVGQNHCLKVLNLSFYGTRLQRNEYISDAQCLQQLLQASSLQEVCLQGISLTDEHFHAIATAIQGNKVIRDVFIPCDLGKRNHSLSLEALGLIHRALEADNFSLHRLSLIQPRLVSDFDNPFRALFGRASFAAGGSDSEDDVDDYCRRCRILQQQINTLCRLNALGRATLASPTTTPGDWIDMFVKCSANGTPTPRSSCRLRQQLDGPVMEVGLNEIFTLVRSYPSICQGSARSLKATAPLDYMQGIPPYSDRSFYKAITFPTTSIAKVMSMQMRKKQRSSTVQDGEDDSSNSNNV